MTAPDINRVSVAKNDKMRYNNPIKNEGENGMDTIDKVGPIQRYYYEDMMCRRDNEVEKWHSAWKKTFIALIVAICLIIGGIIGFIYYEKQFEEIVITAEQVADGDSNNYAIGGDFFGGASKSNYQAPNPQIRW